MSRSLRWRFILYAAIAVFAMIVLIPSVTSKLPSWWSKVVPGGDLVTQLPPAFTLTPQYPVCPGDGEHLFAQSVHVAPPGPIGGNSGNPARYREGPWRRMSLSL